MFPDGRRRGKSRQQQDDHPHICHVVVARETVGEPDSRVTEGLHSHEQDVYKRQAYEPLVRRLPGPGFRAGQHGDFPVRGFPAVRGPRAGGHAGRFMGVFDTRRARLPAFSPLLADYP